MSKSGWVVYRTQGDVVLERLKGQPVPASMKGSLKAFQGVHTRYAKASRAADDARAARDAALARVADDDAKLDAGLEKLAQKSVGAGLGTRQKPLASFTRYAVSDLRDLAYKKEAEEVVVMAAKVAKSGAPKDVIAAASGCAKQANVVLVSLAALVKPQAEYDKALAQRDALLPEWTRAYARLKTMAAAAWADDPATFKTAFAPAEGVQAPKARRAAKKPAAGGEPTG